MIEKTHFDFVLKRRVWYTYVYLRFARHVCNVKKKKLNNNNSHAYSKKTVLFLLSFRIDTSRVYLCILLITCIWLPVLPKFTRKVMDVCLESSQPHKTPLRVILQIFGWIFSFGRFVARSVFLCLKRIVILRCCQKKKRQNNAEWSVRVKLYESFSTLWLDDDIINVFRDVCTELFQTSRHDNNSHIFRSPKTENPYRVLGCFNYFVYITLCPRCTTKSVGSAEFTMRFS